MSSDLARQVAAMRTELRAVHQAVRDLATQVAAMQVASTPTGPSRPTLVHRDPHEFEFDDDGNARVTTTKEPV